MRDGMQEPRHSCSDHLLLVSRPSQHCLSQFQSQTKEMASWFGRRAAPAPQAPAPDTRGAATGVPLELISYDQNTGQFRLGEQAIRALQQTRGPVGVVAVCGRARQVRLSTGNAHTAARWLTDLNRNTLTRVCLANPQRVYFVCTHAGQILHPEPAAGAQRWLCCCAHAPALHQGWVLLRLDTSAFCGHLLQNDEPCCVCSAALRCMHLLATRRKSQPPRNCSTSACLTEKLIIPLWSPLSFLLLLACRAVDVVGASGTAQP